MKNNEFKYPIAVFWSDENESYIAVTLDLIGCLAFGETEEEATRKIHNNATA